MMFIDDAAEYRLLGSVVDNPNTVLAYTKDIFTGERAKIFNAMQQSYLEYNGDISTEGVEKFYGRLLPPEIEAARGAKPGAIVDKLIHLANKRQLSELIDKLTIAMANDVERDGISKMLMMRPIVTSDDSSLAPGITTFTSDLRRKVSGKYTFVSTGIQFLDHMLGGEWPRKGLTVILGQSGGGKTALVVQSILNMARAGIASLFISLEMPRDKIISRMVANISGIDGMRIRSGNVNELEQDEIDSALEEIQELDKYIFIIDRPGMNIHEIQHQVRIHKEAHDIQAFFVDYLQIVDRDEKLDDVEALGMIAQQIRNTAALLDISGIALSQKNGQEGLQSVWGSRRIVHISDVVFEIKMDTSTAGDESRLCQLDFHKNRDGALGMASCLYRPKVLRFE